MGPLSKQLRRLPMKSLSRFCLIMERMSISKGGQWGSALQAAAITRRECIVQLLLDYGTNVTAQGIDTDNALTIASSRNYSKVVGALLDHGANINIVDERWARTPIQAALRCRHVETSVMLLEYGEILDGL